MSCTRLLIGITVCCLPLCLAAQEKTGETAMGPVPDTENIIIIESSTGTAPSENIIIIEPAQETSSAKSPGVLEPPPATMPAPQEDEIIIELTGEPDPIPDGVSVWGKTEKELTDIFKANSREEVLRIVDSVSSADTTLKDANGTKYAYVRYGKDDTDYRKFLFDAKDRFLACADNVATVLQLSLQYHINMGVNEDDFLAAFREEAISTALFDFVHSQELQSYQITLGNAPKPCYLVFENDRLTQIFENDKAYAAYVTQLSRANQQWLEQQEQLQKKQLEQIEKEKEEAIHKERQKRIQFKALLRGGTWEDRLYLPRVLHPEKYPVPPLVPNGTIPGTPIF